jgi:hypothetical protein
VKVAYPKGSVPVWIVTQPMGGVTGPRFLTMVPRVGDSLTMDGSSWEVARVHHDVPPEGSDQVGRVRVVAYHQARLAPPG